MPIDIILIEPEHPGNTGAICRAMGNFDVDQLILVGPKFEKDNEELLNRAKWAKTVLKKIKVKPYSISELKKLHKSYDVLIATTAALGRDYNVVRSPVTPEQLAQNLALTHTKSKVGIVFGREGNGLHNDEVKICDFTMTIPTSKKYGTMNLSHSVAVVLYELFKTTSKENITSHITPMSAKEKEQILKILDETLDKMEFSTKEKKETQRIVWKKLVTKSFLSKREAYAIMGFLKKVK